MKSCDMIYFLTAIGLTRGGGSTVHIYTQPRHRTTQQFGRVRAVPRLCEFYPGICLTTGEKARKNLSQGRKNLSQGSKNLSQGRKSLSQGRLNRSKCRKNLSQGRKNLRQGRKNLSQGRKNLSQGI